MSDDLVNRLRDSCYLAFDDGTNDYASAHISADRIEELQADVKAVLRREHDANKKAFEHLRRAEKAEIASKNYAAFNHEWRKRAEAAEDLVCQAVALIEGDRVGVDWKKACYAFLRKARAELVGIRSEGDE